MDPGACPGEPPTVPHKCHPSQVESVEGGLHPCSFLSLAPSTLSPGCSQGRSHPAPQAPVPTSPGNPQPGQVSTSLWFFCAQESPWQQEKRREELGDLRVRGTHLQEKPFPDHHVFSDKTLSLPSTSEVRASVWERKIGKGSEALR